MSTAYWQEKQVVAWTVDALNYCMTRLLMPVQPKKDRPNSCGTLLIHCSKGPILAVLCSHFLLLAAAASLSYSHGVPSFPVVPTRLLFHSTHSHSIVAVFCFNDLEK